MRQLSELFWQEAKNWKTWVGAMKVGVALLLWGHWSTLRSEQEICVKIERTFGFAAAFGEPPAVADLPDYVNSSSQTTLHPQHV